LKFTQAGEVALGAALRGHDLHLWVQDSGVGMTKEQVANLDNGLQLSSQTGTVGEKGTGLGLRIVKQLVQHWEGRVEVESQLGRGTRVTLVLPALSSD